MEEDGKPNHIQVGEQGELQAAEYLKTNGYVILEKNFRYKRGEVDIICKKESVLVFVEVKTRKNSAFGYPEEFVTPKKVNLFLETAEVYIEQIAWQKDIRFDIISILNNSNEVTHLEDAFH